MFAGTSNNHPLELCHSLQQQELTAAGSKKPIKLNKMRNMSFALTTKQFLNSTKTVTRRHGWRNLKVGEIVRAVEKCQGLKKGEKVKVLGYIKIVSKSYEPLNKIDQQECVKEGFPEMSPADFIKMFCTTHKDCHPETEITRIEFSYVLRFVSTHFDEFNDNSVNPKMFDDIKRFYDEFNS